jgi:hypothetical protein
MEPLKDLDYDCLYRYSSRLSIVRKATSYCLLIWLVIVGIMGIIGYNKVTLKHPDIDRSDVVQASRVLHWFSCSSFYILAIASIWSKA